MLLFSNSDSFIFLFFTRTGDQPAIWATCSWEMDLLFNAICKPAELSHKLVRFLPLMFPPAGLSQSAEWVESNLHARLYFFGQHFPECRVQVNQHCYS